MPTIIPKPEFWKDLCNYKKEDINKLMKISFGHVVFRMIIMFFPKWEILLKKFLILPITIMNNKLHHKPVHRKNNPKDLNVAL